MIEAKSGANILLVMAGLLVWSSAFVALYAALSVGCAFGWDARMIGPLNLQRAVLIGLWLLHLAAIGALLLFARRRVRLTASADADARFLANAVLGATIAAAAVTLINYAPILGLSICL